MIPTLISSLRDQIVQDTFYLSDQEQVFITCPNRGSSFPTIRAPLMNELDFDVESEWASASDALPGGSQAIRAGLDAADRVSQLVAGVSLRQPWFSREYWKGTKPLRFSLLFRFVAWKDAQKEVLDPINQLISLCYPRKTGVSDSLGDIGSLVDFYAIPGPNPFYPITREVGDYVNVSIGKFFYWEACYIKSIKGKLASSLNDEGLPNYAEATINFSTMDLQYVREDGSFNAFTTNFSEYTNNTTAALQKAYSEANEAVRTTIASVTKGA